MRKTTKAPPATAVQVDLAIAPASLQTALERMAQAAELDVANVTLKLKAVDIDAIRFVSEDGAFEMVLQMDGRWRCVYHATIKAAS